MDSENKHDNDEDESVKGAKDPRSVSSRDDSSEPVSDDMANVSENFTSKRVFSESSNSDGVAAEEYRSERASKRLRTEALEPETREQGACGLGTVEANVHLAEMGKEAFPANCSEGGSALPSVFSPSCDFSTSNILPLKVDEVKKPAREMVSLVPERHNPFPPEERSISCSFGSVETGLRCGVCGCSFSSCSALEKHVECHVEEGKERTCCHCSHRAESSSSPHEHVRHTHGPQKVFSCDLCGFQCAEENLLNAHYLGKTHLRRQNLAARGGFVQILTKPSFPSKPAKSDTRTLETPGVGIGNAGDAEAGSVFPSGDGELSSQLSDKKGQLSLETEDLLQLDDACSQREVAGSSDNKCLQCEFSAHSAASLELHVKRKHTKEFQFYCMACDYYAVTRREMTRHAATEKHRMKRQSYLSASSVEAGSSEISKNITIPEEEHSHNSEEFQIHPHQSSGTLQCRNPADCSILDDNTNLGMSKVLCAPDSVTVVTEQESNFSEGHSFCETLQQPLVKDKSMKPREIVSPNTPSNLSLPGCLQSENLASSAVDCETAKKNRDVLDAVGDRSTHMPEHI